MCFLFQSMECRNECTSYSATHRIIFNKKEFALEYIYRLVDGVFLNGISIVEFPEFLKTVLKSFYNYDSM